MKKKDVNNFLDLGTGSGILAILANKLLAKNVVAIDVDSSVRDNLLENLRLNNIYSCCELIKNEGSIYREEKIDTIKTINIKENKKIVDQNSKFVIGFGNVITDDDLMKTLSSTKYDIITINILAPIIISMFDKAKVHKLLNDDGKIILSGIIKEKEQEVVECVKKYLNIIDVSYENEWVSIVVGI